jgi:Ca2+-binding EF-hand superfamily protein
MGNKGHKGNKEEERNHKEEIAKLIANPEDEAALRAIFSEFDSNNSGSLDKEEWLKFGAHLWRVDVEEVLEGEKEKFVDGKNATTKNTLAGMPGPMRAIGGLGGGMRGNMNSRVATELKKMVKPEDVAEWISEMFDKADKDKGGSITFDEFKAFLQHDSKAEADRIQLNFQVAANDPRAMNKANFEASPGNKLQIGGYQGQAKLGGALLGNSAFGQLHKDMHSEFVPGTLMSTQVAVINQFPKMSALYATKKELVTDFFLSSQAHRYDLQRDLLNKNPDLKDAALEAFGDLHVKDILDPNKVHVQKSPYEMDISASPMFQQPGGQPGAMPGGMAFQQQGFHHHGSPEMF